MDKNKFHNLDKKIAFFCIGLVFLAALAVPAYFAFGKYLKKTITISKTIEVPVENQNTGSTSTGTSSATPNNTTKQNITKAPPKHKAGKAIVQETSSNADGSKTTVVSDGDVSSSELSSVIAAGGGESSPLQVKFNDETGKEAALEPILSQYLNSKLRWGNEISSLYSIIIKNAGDTGWEGQYLGSYTENQSGKIVSAYGVIVLNIYYHESDPNFSDYMKLVLSHEYGHHYTLYHKWVDLNLTANSRFPDIYYSERPLSKQTTAIDYSLGWQNCEAEIMAEDYSYLYSGYGYQAMSNVYGYPAAGVRTWLDSLTNQAFTPVAVVAPSVKITAPAAGGTLDGNVTIETNVSGDNIAKVEFFVDSLLVGTATSSPYQITFNSAGFDNGQHVIKAIVHDQTDNADDSITVNFQNKVVDAEKPTVVFLKPEIDPFIWQSPFKDLDIEVNAKDNDHVAKIKVYMNDLLQGEVKTSSVKISWPYNNLPAGTYALKVEAFDDSGNIGESTLQIIIK